MSLQKDILNISDVDSDFVAAVFKIVQHRGKASKIPEYKAASRLIKKAAAMMGRAERDQFGHRY